MLEATLLHNSKCLHVRPPVIIYSLNIFYVGLSIRKKDTYNFIEKGRPVLESLRSNYKTNKMINKGSSLF